MNTSTPRTVIVGVDGSAGSDAAVAWAARHARLAQAELDLVYAVAVPSMAGIGWTVDASLEAGRLLRALRSVGEEEVARARTEALAREPGLTVHGSVITGDPRQVLLDRSSGNHLLVVGSHGLGPVRSLLVGSVGAALARHASCPTVVVRGPAAGGGNVVVGVEGPDTADPLLAFAFEYADLHGLGLTALSARGAGPAADVTAAAARAHPGVATRFEIVREHPSECLLHLAEDASLVVVGTSRHHVGNLAVSVVEHAICPVAVVPVRSKVSVAG